MTREKIIQGLYRGDSRAIKEAIKALEQEPCEDTISRKSMLDYLEYLYGEMSEEEFVKALPSVTPIVHAHWDVIDQDSEGDEVFVHTWETLCCSRCGMERTTEDGYIPQYCESCGAKMDEDERKLKYADQDTMMLAT